VTTKNLGFYRHHLRVIYQFELMSSLSFLNINGQPLSLEQALKYLQRAGKLQPFLLEILYQDVLDQELQARPELIPQPEIVGQAMLSFRIDHQLTNSEAFQDWLCDNNLTLEQFRCQLLHTLMVERLKIQVSQFRLEDYFNENQAWFERVVLSYLCVDRVELAKELYQQLQSGADFEQLATQYSTDENAEDSHVLEIQRGELPENLESAINSAQIGDILGPFEFDDRAWVFRLNEWQPAELDADLEEQLQEEIFEQWLAEKVQSTTVELQVNHDDCTPRSTTGHLHVEPTLERSTPELTRQ
jgi:parvulin-like peptidyl-prolyl isomerase